MTASKVMYFAFEFVKKWGRGRETGEMVVVRVLLEKRLRLYDNCCYEYFLPEFVSTCTPTYASALSNIFYLNCNIFCWNTCCLNIGVWSRYTERTIVSEWFKVR